MPVSTHRSVPEKTKTAILLAVAARVADAGLSDVESAVEPAVMLAVGEMADAMLVADADLADVDEPAVMVVVGEAEVAVLVAVTELAAREPSAAKEPAAKLVEGLAVTKPVVTDADKADAQTAEAAEPPIADEAAAASAHHSK